MEIDIGLALLRPYRAGDEDALAAAANDPRIARNLTDEFPHPYTRNDAEFWVRHCLSEGEPTRNFAIVVAGVLCGGIGVVELTAERSPGAMVGYWLHPDHWGRGIMTAALAAVTDYAFTTFPIERLSAHVYGWNPASARVLEKCGYRLEGTLRNAIRKGGDLTDELFYGRLR